MMVYVQREDKHTETIISSFLSTKFQLICDIGHAATPTQSPVYAKVNSYKSQRRKADIHRKI